MRRFQLCVLGTILLALVRPAFPQSLIGTV